MALDLSLCVVPKQIDSMIQKALKNRKYGDYIGLVPSMLYWNRSLDEEGGGVDEAYLLVKKDVQLLRQSFEIEEADYFYDPYRCTSTLDYLLDAYAADQKVDLPEMLLWRGGNRIDDLISGSQGVPVRLFETAQIKSIREMLNQIVFDDLIPYYDFEKMEKEVYKLTYFENIGVVETAFMRTKLIFNRAYVDDRLILAAID